MSAEVEKIMRAALNLLFKFHVETNCGEDGVHWHECDMMVDALGFDSYDEILDKSYA